jgi:primosomal protein N' (replication factor Y)
VGPERLADVVVDRVAAGLDRTFTYRVPPSLPEVAPGWRVVVPFGRSTVTGLVMGVREDEPSGPVKDILRLADTFPLLPPDLVQLAGWMRERFPCYLPQAVRAMVPAPVRRMEAPLPDALYPGPGEPGRGSARQRLRAVVEAHPGLSVDRALREARVSAAVFREAERQGVVRRGAPPLPDLPGSPHALMPAQARAVEAVLSRLNGGSVLLEGVTGSGKTEVYLTVIEAVLARGRQAIVLVPEIALTPQMRERFAARFPGRVAVFHSAMADGARVREWHRVRRGEASVVLGARSAVFAPCPALGLVVLDEEHETTYKQDEHPRYHARDVARERCRLAGGVLVLGSATPSLETAWSARQGLSGWAVLPTRVEGRPLPAVQVVDMREELRSGHRTMFSRALTAALTETLERAEQAILLINRRGYATAVVCRQCGYHLRCPHCAVGLTVHADAHRAQCHYCLHQEPVPVTCSACGSSSIRQFGVGTEQVAAEVRRLWPTARVLRADHDSLRLTGSHERLFYAFRAHEADVLVGTQLVAKGWDVPAVTLVGVVAADLTLTLPDFRAAERTYALLTQVAGRAGRGDRPGRVVIQTYNPDHYSVRAAAAQNYDAFYEEEIAFREALGYPPFGHLLLAESSHEDAETARVEVERAHALLVRRDTGAPPWQLLGPAPAPLARLRDRYRWHLLVKARDGDRVREAARLLAEGAPGLSLTVDPYYLM